MAKRVLWILLFLAIVPRGAEAIRVDVGQFEIHEGILYADLRLNDLPPSFLKAIRDGIEKRLEINLELFRVWDLWMDEFIGGVELARTVKFGLLKGGYRIHLEGPEGNVDQSVEDEETAFRMITRFDHVPVFHVHDVPRGTYFVRGRVQSRVRELPPVIGGLFFFIPEIEFHAVGQSPRFPLNK